MNKLKLIGLSLVVMGLTACSVFKPLTQPTSTAETITNIAPAVEIAAYTGTKIALKENPEWKNGFTQARDDLGALVGGNQISFASILSIVNRLPVKELQSDTAQISVSSATILLTQYGKNLSLDRVNEYLPIVLALRDGITRALNE